MSSKPAQTMAESLNIIAAIAAKDIVDALKNKVIVSMIAMLSIILLIPKLLPYIFEQSQTVVPVYAIDNSSWMADLKNIASLSIQEVHSEQDLKLALCNAIYPEIGLVVPADIDQVIGTGEPVGLSGFVCWGKRHQVAELQPKLEGVLSQSLGVPVKINLEGNIFYPPSDGVLYLSLATINAVLLILMTGIFLVPSLIIEEKETKTMQALLVSPASISQVVVGKALAGSFYILVSGLLIFAITWIEVIHWDMVLLFVITSGIFSVAVGLVLGSVFDKQQDMAGWMTALLLILIGSALIKALGIELPAMMESILPWVPSVALAEIYRAAISEYFSSSQVWTYFGMILTVSLLLYVVVIVILRRSDR